MALRCLFRADEMGSQITTTKHLSRGFSKLMCFGKDMQLTNTAPVREQGINNSHKGVGFVLQFHNSATLSLRLKVTG